MPNDIFANLILALQQHPILALFFVFLVAFSESLILVGLIVPGALLMILFGALIAMDALEFWPTVLFAISGAIAGDSLSYWLGRRYQSKLNNLWPLSRHPDVIIHANQFFDKHGVKSIFLSRFIGLLRPVIPAIAGMAKMPVKTFMTTNISSAILWAPLYLLPGILFGLSIEMASEFASKFIFLIVFILIIIILILWAIQRIYIFTKPYNDKAIIYLLNWGGKHPLVGEVPAAIFDAGHSELRGLSLVAFIIFTGTLTFSILYHSLILPYNLFPLDINSFDQFVYLSLQTFRTPPLDDIMLWLSYLTSKEFISLICFSLGSLFFFKKDFFALWHWLAAISLPLILSPFFSNELIDLSQQSINISSLPFIVIVSTVGFLTVVINTGLSFARQKLIYYFSATLVLLLMLAQLYFSMQTFSQVLFGLFIASIWFNLLGIAYRRHIKKSISKRTRKEILLIIITLLIYPGWKTLHHEELYTPLENYSVMGTDSWIESGWELLPTFREGIYQKKNNLFNLQWLGTENKINSTLSQLGFSDSQNTTQTLTNWFLENININQLPVLPHIHKGRYESLRFYHYNKHDQELIVIRLWPSKYKLRQAHPLQPLWFGSISLMEVKKKLGVTYLVTKKDAVREIKLDNKNLIIHKKFIVNKKDNKESTIFLLQ